MRLWNNCNGVFVKLIGTEKNQRFTRMDLGLIYCVKEIREKIIPTSQANSIGFELLNFNQTIFIGERVRWGWGEKIQRHSLEVADILMDFFGAGLN